MDFELDEGSLNIEDTFIVDGIDVGVGTMDLIMQGGEKHRLNVTMIDLHHVDGEQVKRIFIPMGTGVGNLFYSGELFMQIRDLWEEWFKENGKPNGT